jgi:hypothetical protein
MNTVDMINIAKTNAYRFFCISFDLVHTSWRTYQLDWSELDGPSFMGLIDNLD